MNTGKRYTKFLALIVLSASHAVSATPTNPQSSGSEARPNILLIVADDLGYADLGVYGSDIRTPNIDALARDGVLFTQFHTAPMCAPTRAMLLSGNNNHVAGMGRQHPAGALKEHMPAYEGYLSDRVAHLPSVLKAAGYHTYTTGKWHLGTEKEHSPLATGFERSFSLMDGAATHFDGRGFENAPSIYRADGELVDYPDGAYSTELYTDRLIRFIDSNKSDGRPFFAFAAYTSPHWPLQVPENERNRYAGVYDDGYDALRERHFESLKRAGIIPQSSTLPPRWDEITPWEDLSGEQQKREARKMELYAAMVENLDGHVGRLLDYLKSNGLFENTLIVFMSDNGAAAEDFYDHEGFRDYIQARYDNAYENMGGPDSFVSYGPQWAEAGSAPFKRHKGFTSEGGITAPMIIAGKGVGRTNEINPTYITVMDLAPTFIDLAAAQYPDDGSIQPMRGENMRAFLEGSSDAVHGQEYITTQFHRNRAYLRQGRWKITQLELPFDEANFALYDLSSDPGETIDLSQQQPEKRAELIELWRQQRQELGLVLPQDL
jgi:arylsulfatase A-like enzyme